MVSCLTMITVGTVAMAIALPSIWIRLNPAYQQGMDHSATAVTGAPSTHQRIHEPNNMRFPAVFVNHGGGPMPLLGKQPALVQNMKDIVKKHLPQRMPKAVVVLSAHWESNPIEITSAAKPPLVFDYYGFPPETYKYEYPAPGSPDLAQRIHEMLKKEGITSKLKKDRGFDHGVFIPLMIMYPKVSCA
jgi:aromatic ring-opening dioxygenase catalytic subunit (LigB family)